MVIQSKKVWLADQFVPAAIEVNDGRITAILPYGTKDVDDDYGDKRIVPGFMTSTAMVPTSSTPTMQTRTACATGPSTSSRRASPASSPPPSPRASRC